MTGKYLLRPLRAVAGHMGFAAVLVWLAGVLIMRHCLPLPVHDPADGLLSADEKQLFRCFDAGHSLVVLGFCLLGVMAWGRVGRWSHLRRLQAPGRPLLFCTLLLSVGAAAYGIYWYFTETASRGYYPPEADSIGIVLLPALVLTVLSVVPLSLLLFLSTLPRNTLLPAPLLVMPRRWPWVLVAWLVPIDLGIAFELWLLVDSIVSGVPPFVASAVASLLLLLSVRAGKIEHYGY